MELRWVQDPYVEADFRLFQGEKPTKWVLNYPDAGSLPRIQEGFFQYPSEIDASRMERSLLSLWRRTMNEGLDIEPPATPVPVIIHRPMSEAKESQIGKIAEPDGTYDLLTPEAIKIMERNRRREERGFSRWRVILFAFIVLVVASVLGNFIWNQISHYFLLTLSSGAEHLNALSILLDSSLTGYGIENVE